MVRWFLWVLLALVVLVGITLAWLLGTNSGARNLVQLTDRLIAAELNVTRLQGTVLQGLRIGGLRYAAEGLEVAAADLQLAWQPRGLMAGQLLIDRLVVGALKVATQATSTEPATVFELPDSVAAPLAVQVQQLLVQRFELVSGDSALVLGGIRLGASWVDTQLVLTGFEVEHSAATARAELGLRLAGSYPATLTGAVATRPAASGFAAANLEFRLAGELLGVMEGTASAVSPWATQLRVRAESLFDEPRFEMTVNAHPAPLGELYPAMESALKDAVLVGEVTAAGNLTGNGLVAQLRRFDINGRVLEQPLALTGQARIAGGEIELGDSRVSWSGVDAVVAGVLGARSNLTADFQIESLQPIGAVLGEPMSGAVVGQIAATGSFDVPRLAGSLQANQLVLAGISAEAISADFSASSAATAPVAILLEASSVDLAGTLIDSARATVEGNNNDHLLRVQIAAPEAALELRAAGELQGTESWRFNLQELDLTGNVRDTQNRWQLDAPGVGLLQFSPVSFSVAELCLSQQLPVGAGQLCATLEEPAVASAQNAATLRLRELDLALLQPLLPAELNLAGSVSADVDWAGAIAGTTASLQSSALKLDVTQAGGAPARLHTAPIELTFRADSVAGTAGKPGHSEGADFAVNIPLLDDTGQSLGGITGAVRATRLMPATAYGTEVAQESNGLLHSGLSGGLAIDLPKLSPVLAMAGVGKTLPDFSGSLVGQIDLGGTMAAPELTGAADLTIAQTQVPDLGIALRDTHLKVTARQQALTFSGQLDSVPETDDAAQATGTPLAFEGEVAWRDLAQQDLRFEARVTGENVLAANRDEALLRVSPDLQVDYDSSGLRLSGRVAVPLAKLKLASVPGGAVSASADQVIAGEDAAAALPNIDADITVALGEDVSFKGLGLKASFAGGLRIRQSGSAPPTALGEVRIVEGEYKAYGQDLTVADGKVLFAGGPVTEPGLDVRAVRQATAEVEVGVQVSGPLAAPVLTVFSTPSLPQSDQLSYLVLGRPMSGNSAEESSLLQQAALAVGVKGGELITGKLGKQLGVDTFGIESAPGAGNSQAALVIGKYLSPRLYVSYGYGLFEPISTLRFDYQFHRRWRIVTESSNEATGGDLQWVLEK